MKVASGCTHIQCPKCFLYMCWHCGNPAKGQKHFKEKPDHYSDEGTLLPEEVTPEIIAKYASGQNIEWVNLKFTVLCPTPGCNKISIKTGDANTIDCPGCDKKYCYLCNKHISGP